MYSAALIFPNQLFRDHPAIDEETDRVVLIEEPLFFGDPAYPAHFHKQKLAYHRATMKRFAAKLNDGGVGVDYHDYKAEKDLLTNVLFDLAENGIKTITLCEPVDFILEKRLNTAAEEAKIDLDIRQTPMFLNTSQMNREYREGRKSWFMADFYKWQRQRLKIMVDDDGKPEGGQWSFDEDNRKKVPKKKLNSVPLIAGRERNEFDEEANAYVEENWPDNPGNLDTLYYPTDHDGAAEWLARFLEERFVEFGPYEDAIVENQSWLWHSVLTPMLNIGLLTPRQVINAVLDHCENHDVPINSREGFIRQIIGWREFMRATYEDLGVTMRTTNHWNHTRNLPDLFYDANTGIAPIDDVIERLNDTAYCHHIERLMVLGGFMFICEIDPDDIYRWFMEMFIDAYDWVMVPNVYAMSQNADGGLITTKPYFSGSAYVKKMSNHRPGDWCDTWDGLYWRFIDHHKDDLASNPRWAMMCAQVKKMDEAKLQTHLDNAAAFLRNQLPDR